MLTGTVTIARVHRFKLGSVSFPWPLRTYFHFLEFYARTLLSLNNFLKRVLNLALNFVVAMWMIFCCFLKENRE